MSSGERRYYGVSPEAFVIAWEKGGSAAEVAQRLGMSVKAVHNRASQYRKLGVQMKRMRRVCVRSLNDLLTSLRQKVT